MDFNPALFATAFGLFALPIGFLLGWTCRPRAALIVLASAIVPVAAAIFLRSQPADSALPYGQSITDEISNAFWAMAATWCGATLIGFAVAYFLTPHRHVATVTPLRAADGRSDAASADREDRRAA